VGPPVGRPAKAGTPTETGEYFDYDSQIYHEGGYPSGNGGPLGWDPFGSQNGSCGCDGCDCGCDSRFEVRGEYLLWSGKGDHLPPLVTTSPVGTPRSTAGVLGAPTTTIRFGDTDANDQARSGGRVTLDAWLTCNQGLGIEANYFILGDRKTNFADSSDPIIARPFFNVESLRQDAQLIAYPGVATGSIDISAKSEFQGAEILLRGNWFEDCCGAPAPAGRLDFLIGYRYLRLAESLTINSESFTTPIDDNGGNDPTLDVSDRFRTVNNFNGADFGALFQRRYCRWSVDFLMKLALGSTNSRVTIGGSTVITSGQTTTAPGGLLAARSNMGTYDRDSFAVVPEIGLTLGYDVTCQLRATAGYTFLYWSQVARPPDQIDLNVNPNGGAFPQFNFHCADFWAQGLTLGLDYRF
jgi:Putative beta barrel porin-7 (BBP7)